MLERNVDLQCSQHRPMVACKTGHASNWRIEQKQEQEAKPE